MIDRYKVNIVQSYHAGNWESPELINVKDPEGEFVKYEDHLAIVKKLEREKGTRLSDLNIQYTITRPLNKEA